MVLHCQTRCTDTERTLPLIRSYRLGETVAYKMQATNQGQKNTAHYEVIAKGKVLLDNNGDFVEDLNWSNLLLEGRETSLTAASEEFRENLSLAPNYKLSIPNLTKVQPTLIGPIVDLLTFYADVQLAMSQHLVCAGDHVYIKHGKPNSWADGKRTVFGQDSVDFDVTLDSVDEQMGVATLVVRHIAPTQSYIDFPAAWMNAKEGDPINNWAQVQMQDNGTYTAGVGRESFSATIKLSLANGRILSAVMENPVKVSEKQCTDAAASQCGDSTRYTISRHIVIMAIN
jgi:hypothetical protein